jgi:hypothetical protein
MNGTTERPSVQTETSRRNGCCGRGPVSSEGKRCASRNSLKHGLCAERIPLLPHESPEVYRQHTEAWGDALKPANAAEQEVKEP